MQNASNISMALQLCSSPFHSLNSNLLRHFCRGYQLHMQACMTSLEETHVENMRTILKDQNWKVKTTVRWVERDRWESYDGVGRVLHRVKAQTHQHSSGHHIQEDSGEELAKLIAQVVGSRSRI